MITIWGIQKVGNEQPDNIILFTKKKYAYSFKKRVEDMELDQNSYETFSLELIELKLHNNQCGKVVDKNGM